ncbi:MAG: hypothetical protein E5V58_30620 [Mesorhizobium sp.]|nr:MAG: hypothetical protein EOS32_26825 [Mesorhizobium sp.]TIW65948.1 MAG: hypothetical protein E5V58_30620 [Mesorhizobium sp.]
MAAGCVSVGCRSRGQGAGARRRGRGFAGEDRGAGRVANQIPCREAPLSVLPDISPSRGEIGSSSDDTPLTTSAIGETLRDI